RRRARLNIRCRFEHSASATPQAALSLARRANHHDAAIEAGHSAAHQDQVLVGIDLHDLEIAHGDAFVAVAASHADALLGPAAAAVAGVGTDRAVLPPAFLDAVGMPQAAEVVPFDDAREAAAL